MALLFLLKWGGAVFRKNHQSAVLNCLLVLGWFLVKLQNILVVFLVLFFAVLVWEVSVLFLYVLFCFFLKIICLIFLYFLFAGCNSIADLVFLLDESGSVGRDNFDKMKIFLEKVVGHLTIGKDNIRVSLVKFGSDSTIVTYLNQDQTNEEVIKSIEGLTYNSGMTATDKGINTVTNKVFNKKNRGQETGRAQVLVVITDGKLVRYIKQ